MSLFINLKRKNALHGHLFCLRGGYHELGEDSVGVLTQTRPVHSILGVYQTSHGWCLASEGSTPVTIGESEYISFELGNYIVSARMSRYLSDALTYTLTPFIDVHPAGLWLKAQYCQVLQRGFVPYFRDFSIGSSHECGMCIPLSNLEPRHAILTVSQDEAVLKAPNGSILSRSSIGAMKSCTLLVPPLSLELKLSQKI